jgi:S1-C subfamily serine protease
MRHKMKSRTPNLVVATIIALLIPLSVRAQISTGTGFFITESGYVVTNHHVVEGATELQIRTVRGETFPARLVRLDRANDLAIIKADAKAPALAIVRSSTIRRGDSVFTLGYPNTQMQGFSIKFTDGSVSSLAGIRDEPNTFQISVPVQPGNSGGPLLNKDGNVVGVVVAKLNAATSIQMGAGIPEAVNYAIKSNYLLELIETEQNVSDHLISLDKKKRAASIPDTIARLEPSVVLVIARQISPKVSTPPVASPPSPQPTTPRYSNGPGGNVEGAQCRWPADCGAGLTCKWSQCVPY